MTMLTLDALIVAAKWIGGHTNRVAGVVRAFFYMGVVLTWWHWTPEQMGAVMAFVESVLYMVVETNTVSKQRLGERIDSEVERRTGTGG